MVGLFSSRSPSQCVRVVPCAHLLHLRMRGKRELRFIRG